MKILATIVVILFCALHIMYAQKADTIDATQYFVINSDPTILWVYKVGEASFLDVYSAEKETINSNEYSVRIRKYSTGAYDTAFYRLAPIGFLRAFRFPGPKGFRESIVLPRYVFTGLRWAESDSGWTYQVTSTNDSITTPAGTYRNLIAVTATPVKTTDAAARVNRLYFAKGVGMVANTVQDVLQVYLTGMKKVTGVPKDRALKR